MPTKKRTTTTSSSAPETTHLWLALDPETRRVLVQDHEFADGDFPAGLRGLDWPRRELDVPASQLAGILDGSLSGAEVDRLHRDWWDQARGEGDPMWPNV